MVFRAAVIGCGPRGIEHAQALTCIDGIELVAMADRSAEAVRQATGSLGVQGYLAIEEALERSRPDIVVLATPALGRAELTERVAAFAGVQAIIAEKPMAMTMAEAERMVAVCEARGIVLTVCHQWRFGTEIAAMKAAIEAGELGDVEFLRGSCYGNLLRQGVHVLDAMRWLTGGRNILWVMSQWSDDAQLLGRHARGDQGYWDDPSHPTPMWMTHHLAFEGGARATMETGLLYQRSRSFLGDWLQQRITVIGSEGLAEGQVGGHFKLLSARQAGWKIQEGSVEGHLAATRAFHEELREALETGLTHRNNGRDALKTLEAILACVQSAADGTLIPLPLSRDRDPVSELEALRPAARTTASPLRSPRSIPSATTGRWHATQPDVSVIVALPDHQGLAIECVESLVRSQTYPRDRFEVIVVTDGTDPALESRVKALLGPQDRMISHATTNESLLYDLGARQARGKLLFITEPHCIAEPECLDELVKFFATHDYDGACCRSVGICPNVMARMKERYFEEGFAHFSRPGDWRKVLWRGFAIHRDVYLREGGLEHAFDRFAEFALAAKLHAHGRRLGYAAGATVRHRYTPSLGELFPSIRDFTRGECAYRVSAPVEYCERYFGYAPEWAQRGWFRPAVARLACRASWNSLWAEILRRGGWQTLRTHASALLRFLPLALLGPRVALLGYRWLLRTAVARCWLWRFNEKRLYRAFCDAYGRMVRYSRLEFIMEHLAATPAEPPAVYDLRPAEIGEEWLAGFKAVDRWGGEPFRWSGPVSVLRLGLPAGTYDVTIETRSLRQDAVPLCLRIFFNRHTIPASSLRWNHGVLGFRIDRHMFEPGPEQRLILTCNPLQPSKQGAADRRKLGLPIFSIAFVPLGEPAGANDDAAPASARAGDPALEATPSPACSAAGFSPKDHR
jgi:predicted dehydrogenase/GT2 family glycosyltransferase